MNAQLSMSFESAADAAEEGMRAAAAHAEEVSPGWGNEALNVLYRFARVQVEPFTIEAARAATVGLIPEPPDGRAWGAVTQRAIRGGVIYKTGAFAAAVSSNGSPKPLYTGIRPLVRLKETA